MSFKAAVVTVSDSVSAGRNSDDSGPEASRILVAAGAEILEHSVVSDDIGLISDELVRLSAAGASVIVTNGGTGVSPRDNTPEATIGVCDRMVPGIGELMRSVSVKKTPYASLSRAVAGIRGATLIVNLPGSPGGVRDCLEAVIEVIPHAVGLLENKPTPHLQT
ncbi:MAG: MogA/MoaB family molybdenum cofactor biosynthesis protein [Actinomycetota bacterium]